MLSRRNLRVKVMQVLYALDHSNSSTIEQSLRLLEKSIEKSYQLVVFNLALLVRISDHIKRESGIKSSKFLPTEADLQFSDRLAGNPIIQSLRNDRKIGNQLKLEMSEEEKSLVKDLFKKMSETEEYKLYCTKHEHGKTEKEIILFIYNNVIQKNHGYLQYVEDNFPECISELAKINFGIAEIIENISPKNLEKPLKYPDSGAEELFAKELLEKTQSMNERFTELVQPKLKNWDLDRIASIDMILMKMALCELLCFEQIPVKVSINEYIDISKTYSTPRSKDFINGILDNIMHELRDRNEIRKTGRGLVE